MEQTVPPLDAKIVILGSQGVGKTSIIKRYVSDVFDDDQTPTIGASYCSCRLMVGGRAVKLQVWDTAGQERFRSMLPMYYRNASGALLVYDITSRQSFESLKTWVKELHAHVDNHIVLVVLGNKSDLQDTAAVSLTEAEAYATENGAKHFLTSALAKQGIHEVFAELGGALVRAEAMLLGLRSSFASSDAFTLRNTYYLSAQETPAEDVKKGCC